jgi:hypothetical protein
MQVKTDKKWIPMNNTRTYRNKISIKYRKAADRRLDKTPKKMSLPELRQTRNVSQENLAASMNKKQPNLSKMERSSDMYVSTLCKFIKAMGGNLEIIAHFPDGKVRINQFERPKR